jgi:hypothetical protein
LGTSLGTGGAGSQPELLSKNSSKLCNNISYILFTAHKEGEQLGDRKNDGESNCNSGDGTGQMAQPWMFMMMMMIFSLFFYKVSHFVFSEIHVDSRRQTPDLFTHLLLLLPGLYVTTLKMDVSTCCETLLTATSSHSVIS